MLSRKVILRTAGTAVKLTLFTILAFLRPVVAWVCHKGSWICLIGFLFCFFISKGQSPYLHFLLTGLGLTAFIWIYDTVLSLLAPGSGIYTEK